MLLSMLSGRLMFTVTGESIKSCDVVTPLGKVAESAAGWMGNLSTRVTAGGIFSAELDSQ